MKVCVARLAAGALTLLAVACAREAILTPPAPLPATTPSGLVPPSRVAAVRTLDADCELALPFLEGLHVIHAAATLKAAKTEYLDLAYPGALSIPMVAWRCGGSTWTSLTTTAPLVMPTSLVVRVENDALEIRLECFGPCELRELHGGDDWRSIAKRTAAAMDVHAKNPSLRSRYDGFDFFVRQWVAGDSPPFCARTGPAPRSPSG